MFRRHLLLLTVIQFFTSTSFAVLPPAAQSQLNRIGGKLTVDFVIAQAAGVSDSFQVVDSAKYRIPQGEYLGLATTEFKLFGSVGQTHDKRDNQYLINGKSYDELNSKSTEIGATALLPTGTTFTASLEEAYQNYETTFSTVTSEIDGYEDTITFEVSQSLLNNAFGYGTLKGIRAGQLSTEADENRFKSSVSEWSVSLAEQFYLAWNLQQQVIAARDGLQRRRKLLEATKLKLGRGTAERPDLLQTESAHLASEVQLQEAEQKLAELWRQLVIQLKLPREWMAIDATQIPMELDEPYFKALQLCGPRSNLNNAPTENLKTKEYELRAEAADLKVDKASNSLLPDVKLVGQYFSNGLDDEKGQEAYSDAKEFDKTGYYIGATVEIPFGRYKEKADLSQARAEKYSAEASASMERSNLQVNWINDC
ncbi:MAG: TolC family protein, partial [Bdellovibrionales bacterium]|nr:TolC family protein [Bdellovibrionales bacterium]